MKTYKKQLFKPPQFYLSKYIINRYNLLHSTLLPRKWKRDQINIVAFQSIPNKLLNYL